MFRNIAVIAAVATIAVAASPAGAQYGSYGQVQNPPPPITYAANPGPYGGTAPVPYSYGYAGAPYGGGLVTSNVALSGNYYGSEYGGPFSGPFRTDSAPLTGGGY
ncbi:MAG: hypothetical protein JO000_03455 [Alphaproteobacteria bacterium]|nr:hypothetical protein [Alphaproteobacteria bacterium]